MSLNSQPFKKLLMRSRTDSIESAPTSPTNENNEIPIIVKSDSLNSFACNSRSGNSTPRTSMATLPITQLVVGEPPVKMYRRSQDMTLSRNMAIRRSITPSLYSMSMEITQEEKSMLTRKNLTVMFSGIYAVLLTVVGGVIYISYQHADTKHICEIFSTFVAVVGLSWLMFFHVDLFIYKRRCMANLMKSKKEESNGMRASIDYSQSTWITDESLTQPYRFLTGRHSGSFYLKTGLAAFCFGHLINEGLQLGQQIINFTQVDSQNHNCGQMSSLVLHCIRPIYSFYQLFIIFKYANIVINQYKEMARFALMHIVGTCLCFWFGSIAQDAMEDFEHGHSAKNKTAINESIHPCASSAIFSVNNLEAIPYLYPFTVEFNILLAGVWYILWDNVGLYHHRSKPNHFSHKINTDDGIEEITFQSNLVISADCHASNKGLFAGLFLLMASIISIIVFFVAMSTEGYTELGVTLHTIQEAVMTIVSLVGVILAYRQLSKLDINLHPVTFLDDVLLFIPLPFFFIHSILTIVAELHKENTLRIVVTILHTIQIILQTPFISDGLRRCSNEQALRYKKSGREVVTFLVVCNLTMWIINTFEAKSVEHHQAQFTFFGEHIWMFIGHATLPLMLFYRFHSSVCLADIWKSAYEKGE